MEQHPPTPGTAWLSSYLARIDEIAGRGGEREESYYSSLEALLLDAAAELGHRDVRITPIPKRTQACQLDFQIWRGNRVAGYVEAKHPRCRLGEAIESAQIRRYRDAFPNLLVTNLYNFALLRGEREAAWARAVRPHTAGLGHPEPAADPISLLTLLDLFFAGEAPRFSSADALAVALAERTRLLAQRVEQVLDRESAGLLPGPGAGETDAVRAGAGLWSLYRTFEHHLIHNLTGREFADLYAQTVAYGLLIARWRTDGPFTRRTVFDAIPPPLGILRDLFRYIALGTPPPEIAWVVEDLVELLAAAPVPELLRRAYHESNGRDPVLHFYETFLARYDQALRKRRGVYYTPLPVVSYMVRSVHRLLQTRLGRPGGLAHPGTTLLDPAAGTLTFLVEAFRVAIEAYRAEAGEGGLAQLVGDHLLPHFHGFELMMAPYVIGHLKMGLMLAEWGFPLADDQRVQLYLTDALEPEPLAQSRLPGVESLSRESRAAGRIKTEQPVTVVLGNPPYSGHSANAGSWIRDLIAKGYHRPDGSRDEGYYRVDGQPLGERNPKWLQDDYVKFLRFAQWKIEQNGHGVAALVTNHGYLENPTFRGLRRSLLLTFDEIYLLDLGGSRLERGARPAGEPDENVFPEVSRGVVIALLVKLPAGQRSGPCRVYTAALRGSRAGKARRLLAEDVGTTAWSEIAPRAGSYRFRAGDEALEEEYRRGVPLDRLFPLHSAGVVTARDRLALAFDRQDLIDQFHAFRAIPRDSATRDFAPRDTGTWRLEAACHAAGRDDAWRDKLTTLLYRPFDRRHLLYADYLVERPRRRVMRHLLGTDVPALVAPRQCKEPFGALVTTGLAGHKAVSAADVNSVFPLYLVPDGEGLFAPPAGRPAGRDPNLASGLLDQLAAFHGAAPAPEEVLAYVYALLYSPSYRARYAGPLRRGFARIPFARDPALFRRLAGLGQELVDLHLERSPRLWPALVRFCGAGDGTLGTARLLRAYRPGERRVVVNAAGQSFEGIAPGAWEYRIGGTQVLPRWLAARAGRRLTLAEIEDFRRAATVLSHTLELEKKLEEPALEAIRDSAPLELPGAPRRRGR